MRHIAVVFPRLVDAAVDHIGHSFPINLRVARHQSLERNCAKIVSANGRQRAAVAAKGCADRIDDVGVVHISLKSISVSF